MIHSRVSQWLLLIVGSCLVITEVSAFSVNSEEFETAESRRANTWFKGVGIGGFDLIDDAEESDTEQRGPIQFSSVQQQQQPVSQSRDGVNNNKRGDDEQEDEKQEEQQEQSNFRDFYYGKRGQQQSEFRGHSQNRARKNEGRRIQGEGQSEDETITGDKEANTEEGQERAQSFSLSNRGAAYKGSQRGSAGYVSKRPQSSQMTNKGEDQEDSEVESGNQQQQSSRSQSKTVETTNQRGYFTSTYPKNQEEERTEEEEEEEGEPDLKNRVIKLNADLGMSNSEPSENANMEEDEEKSSPVAMDTYKDFYNGRRSQGQEGFKGHSRGTVQVREQQETSDARRVKNKGDFDRAFSAIRQSTFFEGAGAHRGVDNKGQGWSFQYQYLPIK